MLKDTIGIYLAARQATGFTVDNDRFYLNSFARFAAAQDDTHIVTQTAIAWAAQARREGQRALRLQAVIRFARFSCAEETRHEIPPDGVFCGDTRRPTPYLFTETELQALMAQASQLGPTGSLRPKTYNTLFGLLAVTGLRVSEAIALRFHDLTVDGLVIRESKFRKSRLVALHPTTHAALERYLCERRQLAVADDHVFISYWRRSLKRGTVYRTFRQLIAAAGLPRGLDQPRPRVMDLRHSFASSALLACPDSRDHVGRHTLALMTYLGHAHPSSTFWYLERSPQLVSDIARACEHLVEEHIQ